MQVHWIDIGLEAARASAALQDAVQGLDYRHVQIAQSLGTREVLGVVNVLNAHQSNEIRMRIMVIEGEFDDAAYRRQTV